MRTAAIPIPLWTDANTFAASLIGNRKIARQRVVSHGRRLQCLPTEWLPQMHNGYRWIACLDIDD